MLSACVLLVDHHRAEHPDHIPPDPRAYPIDADKPINLQEKYSH